MTQPPPECLKEMKVQAVRDLEESSVLLMENTPDVGITHVMNCEDLSDFSKLCRVTAYVICFVNNIKAQSSRPVSPLSSGSLTSEEVFFCESWWIKESQKSLPLNRNFKQQCAQLGVITDKNGIFRCKGRLCNSSLLESAKLPAWLPCDHHITRLIIRDCQHRVMHNGVRETLTELRSRFWLTKGRQVIRKQIYNCVVCRRHEGRSYKVEPSSDMPDFRFKEGTPFASTGVDFAGPLFVKSVFGKEIQVSKVYICLFTCGRTRAIHKKTLGKARLTYEELLTVLIEVECILNSRPLTYLYPDDLEEPLTPSHLSNGRRMLSLPDVTRSGIDNSSTRETVTKEPDIYRN